MQFQQSVDDQPGEIEIVANMRYSGPDSPIVSDDPEEIEAWILARIEGE